MHRRRLLERVVIVALAALALGAPATAVGATSAPTVDVAAPRTVIGPAGDVLVRVTLANPTAEPMRILEWSTPAGGVAEPLFEITRDGVPVEYIGPLAKRAAPTAADYLLLEPGASRTFTVDLAETYSFAAGGDYAIRYRTSASELLAVGRAKVAGGLVSNQVSLVVSGRPDPLPAPLPSVGSSSVDNPGCSTAEEADLATALTAAHVYATEAVQYFADNRAGSRYQTWFGAYSATRWQTVRAHFQAIAAVTAGTGVRFTCHDAGCGPGVYAFVYPDAPYRVYPCDAFWTASNTGTDSRAGTLIHEISHFTVVAETDDRAYGQGPAAALAVSHPNQAVDNADSHEYFAENTPATVDNAAAFTVSAAAHDFGTQELGAAAAPFTFTVTSTGDANVVFGTVAVVGDFVLTGGTCTGATLAPATSCTITAAFAPIAAGAASGSIGLPSNAVAAPGTLALTGTGASPPPAPVAVDAAAAPAAPAAPAAAVRVSARAKGASRLVITVGTATAERWTFRIRVRRPNGTWAVVTTARGVPGGAVRIIDLPKGRYQVVVDAGNGMKAGMSPVVSLVR